MQDRTDYVAANRDAWNEAAPRHARHNQERLKALLADGYNHLSDEYVAMLGRVGICGKRVVQVCCNNGLDLLSAKGMGAGECLGIDQAPAFLEQARELAVAAGHADVTFLEASAYALPQELNGQFDIVMTTIGVTAWMPDIKAFFAAVAALLRPGGHWVMEEMHPVLMMYEPDPDGGPSQVTHSYFRTEPFVETDGLDYFGHEKYDSAPNYSFTHRISDLVNAGIAAGLQLQFMDEVGRDISNFCSDLETAEALPPLGLYMLWYKPA